MVFAIAANFLTRLYSANPDGSKTEETTSAIKVLQRYDIQRMRLATNPPAAKRGTGERICD